MIQALFFPIAIAASYTDIKHKIIPNWLVFVGIAVGLYANGPAGLTGGLIGFAAMLSAALLALHLYGKTLLGGGDIKFMAMIGTMFGADVALWTFAISPFIGFIVGILSRRTLAYGPCIGLAAIIVLYSRGFL